MYSLHQFLLVPGFKGTEDSPSLLAGRTVIPLGLTHSLLDHLLMGHFHPFSISKAMVPSGQQTVCYGKWPSQNSGFSMIFPWKMVDLSSSLCNSHYQRGQNGDIFHHQSDSRGHFSKCIRLIMHEGSILDLPSGNLTDIAIENHHFLWENPL